MAADGTPSPPLNSGVVKVENATNGLLHSNASILMRHGNDSLLGNVSSTGFIDVEEDSISPGWAVLLMYMMLVRQYHPRCLFKRDCCP